MDRLSEQAEAAISILPDYEVYGRVSKVLGLLVEIAGFGQGLSIGSHQNGISIIINRHHREDVAIRVTYFLRANVFG